jgi:hypothetical protein
MADPDETVRHRVAWNAKTPESILEQLTVDPSAIVSEAARARLAERRAKKTKLAGAETPEELSQ